MYRSSCTNKGHCKSHTHTSLPCRRATKANGSGRTQAWGVQETQGIPAQETGEVTMVDVLQEDPDEEQAALEAEARDNVQALGQQESQGQR